MDRCAICLIYRASRIRHRGRLHAEEFDAEMTARITESEIERIIAMIPESWLGDVEEFSSVDDQRHASREYLMTRLQPPRAWVEEAARARALLV